MRAKRAIATLLAPAIGCSIAWIFGFDFNERGFDSGMVTILCAFLAVMTYTCPIWNYSE